MAGTEVRRAWLAIDETTAHAAVPCQEAESLLAWFLNRGVPCRIEGAASPSGFSVVNFGNPTQSDEHRIRTLFAEWQRATAR
jgi:hypothetical protein